MLPDEVSVSPRTSFAVFIGSLFLLLAMMSYQITDRASGRTVLGSVLFRLISPIQLLTHQTFSGTVFTFHTYFSLIDTNRENAELRKEVNALRIQMAAVSEQTRENERLRKILELSEKVQYRLIVGEVIGRDAKAAVSDTIVANRGSRQGVAREMPVVTPIGIVGMTIGVDLFTSKVQLITDVAVSVGAMLQKDRTAGILSGAGNGRCILRYLPLSLNAKAGDLIVTSGQDGVFPEGLPVGRVGKQIKESALYKSLEIVPFQNVSSLAEVVFLSPSRQTIATLPVPIPKSK